MKIIITDKVNSFKTAVHVCIYTHHICTHACKYVQTFIRENIVLICVVQQKKRSFMSLSDRILTQSYLIYNCAEILIVMLTH